MQTNLKSLREKYGYSQEYVAEKINVSLKMYGKYERGKAFSTDILIQLKELYNTTTDDILGLNDNANTGDKYIHDVTGLSYQSIGKLRSLNEEFQPQAQFLRYGAALTNHIYTSTLDKMRLPIIDKFLSSKYCDDMLSALVRFSFPNSNTVPCTKDKNGNMQILDTDTIYMASDKNRLDDTIPISLNQIMDKSIHKTKLDILLQEFSNEYSKYLKRIMGIK